MTTTIFGQIQGGRIVTSVPLAELEGRTVEILVRPTDAAGVEGAPESPPTSPDTSDDSDDVELEDCGRIRLPPRGLTSITVHIRDVERRPMPVYENDPCDVDDEAE